MSILVKPASTAARLRVHGTVVEDRFGPLHTRDTLLEWGSITKTVTATIASLLDREQLLSLDDPVREYLPRSLLPRSVTVSSLVSHTSGLSSLPADALTQWADLVDPYAKYTTAHFDEQVIPRLNAMRSRREGEFSYSNLGYAVLTRALERASGESWWTLARDRVLAPWGIADVALNHVGHLTERIRGRTPQLTTLTGRPRSTWTDTGPFVGAGGIMSTFDALEAYAQASRAHGHATRRDGWMRADGFWWHNGNNRDQGAYLGISDDGARIVTAHTIARRIGAADRIARRLLRAHGGGA